MNCPYCDTPMRKTRVQHKGNKYNALQCPHCREKLFSEELWDEAITKLQQARLKERYHKKPLRLGHSWGITLPKAVVDVFGLDQGTVELKPDVRRGVIEIRATHSR